MAKPGVRRRPQAVLERHIRSLTAARPCATREADGTEPSTMIGWMFRALHRIIGWPRTPEEEEQAIRVRKELEQEKERRAIDEAEVRIRMGLRWPWR